MEPQSPSGEGRALSAAMSAPTPFTGRAGAAALHASERHVDRWAPERDAVGRSRSLGTLSFVDRLISPWLTGAAQPPRGGGASSGSVASSERGPWSQGVSWVFPRPWYQDELDWMAAAREGGEQSRRGLLTTGGTYARPDVMHRERPPAATVTVGSGDQTVLAVADQLPRHAARASNYEYVAPSMSAASPPGAARGGLDVRTPGAAASIAHTALPMHRALRAWSPQVSFAAAQAAELMAGTVAIAEQAGLTTASRSPVLEGLAYVAPSELAASSGPSVRGGATPVRGEAAAHVARSIAQLAAVQAVSRTTTVEAARAAVAETAAPVRTAASLAPSAAGSSAPAVSAPAVAEAYRAEQDRVIETMHAAASAPIAEPSAAATATSWPSAGPTAATYQDLVRVAAVSPAAAQAMRTVELVARSALSGSSAPTAGPRVALPAGLGGALAGVQAASTAAHPMMAHAAERTEPASIGARGFTAGARPMVSDELLSSIAPTATVTGRGFVPVWATPDAGPAALSAVAGGRPAAMGHLAWADRWLARLSGASPASLSALDIAAEHTLAVPRAFAAGAPEMGYVIPSLLDEPARPAGAATTAVARSGRAAATASPPLRAPAAPPTTALRIGDDEVTPDEVFAAIARAARPRRPPTAAETARPMPVVAAESIAEAPAAAERFTVADQIARTAPSAPSAGLYAGLASSPMAPALAGILPLPAAPMFDPRAMFASGLVSAYVGGAMLPVGFAPAATATAAGLAAASAGLASWARLPGGMTVTEAGLPARPQGETLGVAGRAPAPAWISPTTPGLPLTSLPPSVAPSQARTAIAARAADDDEAAEAAPSATATMAARSADPVWSLHGPVLAAPAPMAPTTGAGVAAGFSLDAPLLEMGASGWTSRPGMVAERAQGFAVEHERAAADLSFDFVSPELVLAARVYGFGPAEAAQASRLAVAGPAGLAAMASTLDLTFLRQLHIAAEHPGGAAPDADPGILTAPRRAASRAQAQAFDASGRAVAAEAASSPLTAYPTSPQAPAMPLLQPAAPIPAQAPAGTVFGVERRLPRGSFLWPAGAVSALDLRANMPEGSAMLPVAALELLAASAVAEMGSLVSPASADVGDDAGDEAPAAMAARRGHGPAMRGLSPFGPFVMPSAAAPDASLPAGGVDPSAAAPASGGVEPAVEQIADAVAVPAAHRARFESVYLALSQSPQGQSMSPSVRAARALSIAARQDVPGAPSTAHDRAMAAWSVMPVVFSSPGAADGESAERAESSGAELGGFPMAAPRAGRAAGAPPMSMLAANVGTELRPGLSGLSARAGEAIGGFVHPSGQEVARASSGAVRPSGRDVERPGSEAIRELVRSGGRSFSRTGGGEVEIPSWFESAARRMIESRGVSDQLSIADLTLISSTPSNQIAASTRSAGSASSAPSAPSGAGSAEQGEKADVAKITADVYGEIIRMLEVARERSGDPWQ